MAKIGREEVAGTHLRAVVSGGRHSDFVPVLRQNEVALLGFILSWHRVVWGMCGCYPAKILVSNRRMQASYE